MMLNEGERWRIAQGDCLAILPTLADGCVDAVITDPPYGTKKAAWDSSIDEMLIVECLRVSRGYCTFFYSNTRLWHLLGIIHGLGMDAWVAAWHKPNAMGFERKFAPQWVPIIIMYRKNSKFFGQDLIACPIVPQEVEHPTPKPIPVTTWLVERTTEPRGMILDPFMGSGTTGVAALRTGRRFLGIEIDKNYCATARRRLEQEEAQPQFDGLAGVR